VKEDQRIGRQEEPGNANFTRVKHWVKGAKRSLVYYTGDTDDKVVEMMERKGVRFWKCPSFVSPKVQGSRFRCPGLLDLQNWGISKLERFSTHPSSASPPLCRLCNTRATSRPFHPVFYTSEVSHRQANHWPISANPESFCLFGRPILLLRSS
jgi:hypothetical protein